MKIRLDNSDAEFGYLSVNGKAMTYDTAVLPSSMITGQLSASTYFTDPIASRVAKELALNFTVASGTGQLAVRFLILDPMEPSNGTTGVSSGPPPPVASITLGNPLGAPSTLRYVIAEGNAVLYVNGAPAQSATLNPPMFWQVKLSLSGTLPKLSVIGTYEFRG